MTTRGTYILKKLSAYHGFMLTTVAIVLAFKKRQEKNR